MPVRINARRTIVRSSPWRAHTALPAPLFPSRFARCGAALQDRAPALSNLAVSATNQCAYCIASHTAGARKAGMTDQMFAELMAVVGMANETNRLASGYQVEVDERFKAA